MEDAYKALGATYGDRLRKDEPLAGYTTFKIGGPADLFFEAKTSDELISIVRDARNLLIPTTVIGGGSNILISDKGIRGLVVKNSTSKITLAGFRGTYHKGVPKGSVFVEAESGVIMNKLVRFTIEEGLSGLEMQLGLPGTVGGAVYMNSKWTHPEGYVGDALHQAVIMTGKNELRTVPRSYFHFGYDTSILQKTKELVIRAVFSLRSADKDALWKIADQSIRYRRDTQPQGVKSSGCIFRNISPSQAMTIATPNYTTSAGYLLDRSGMKGVCVGSAHVSPMHANFIINTGRARASDVVELIDMARNAVKAKFGVELKEEIVRMGEF
jgi:UDP-N-acetylenolpyruvoylglucosamine reductase